MNLEIGAFGEGLNSILSSTTVATTKTKQTNKRKERKKKRRKKKEERKERRRAVRKINIPRIFLESILCCIHSMYYCCQNTNLEIGDLVFLSPIILCTK